MTLFREKFRTRCAVDREKVEAAFASWRSGGTSAYGELVSVLHGLAGAGGTFGFSSLSEQASEAEERLLDTGPEDAAPHEERISSLVDKLRRIEQGEAAEG
jgi:HPt (histidine-containing phosphotransfer) domain-containing protein